jgi:2-polyprenyl-6-hydroxyphenyl methylase/3-demethylubiquinone-9 3-methyltransferase
MTAVKKPTSPSVDPNEVAHFASMAETWWDPHGPFRPLHLLNPARLSYLAQKICAHFDRLPETRRPLKGLSLLDIGCGGGLLSEPMSRLGAKVTGIDAAEKNIAVAALHAQKSGLDINYQAVSAETLASRGKKFDIVLTLEVIEHVADIPSFLKAASQLLAPDGLMILSTLNRTPKAFLLAIIGAEYVLRWLPRGTHDWKKFLKPDELKAYLAKTGLTATDVTGLIYNPLSGHWSTSARDFSVNYMVSARHDGGKS